ncbi:MAG: hypothetical protein HYY24_07725, partial [Verrucomicrobia bacterium]|nr:hypothetical protein [Verrucomicrobiota bacterium]
RGALEVIDVSNPANPQRIGAYDTDGEAWGVAVSGNFAYVRAWAGLQVIDVSDPANPRRVGGNSAFDSAFDASAVVVHGDNVYVVAAEGLVILNTYQPSLRLEPPFRLDAAGFHLQLRAESGQAVRLQRSTDLKTWTDWQTVTGTGSSQPLVDENAGADPVRFYRALVP